MYTLEDVRRICTGRKSGTIGEHRFFSVFTPFVEREGELCLLYEVRAKSMKSQPGEICFPGGAMEEGESPEQAAVRETAEETGISAEKIEVTGPGDVLYGYADYTLYTTIGTIDYRDYLEAVPAQAEVEELFLVSLKELEAAEPLIYQARTAVQIGEDFPYKLVGIGRDYPWRRGRWQIPVYRLKDRTIWGITARITENLIKILHRDSF